MFLKNKNVVTAVETAKKVLESCAKTYGINRFSFVPSHTQLKTESTKSDTDITESIPQTLVLLNIFAGYKRIYEAIKNMTIYQET